MRLAIGPLVLLGGLALGDALQQQPRERLQARARSRRGCDHRDAAAEAALPLGNRRSRPLLPDEVDLGKREHARQLGEARIVRLQLVLDRLVVGGGVRLYAGGRCRADVQHVHEDARALEVGEKIVPEAGAAARALDEPGNVGHDQLALVALENSQHG